ncbi:polysaccharide pyruvyl transferase family protein [Alteromonas gracilis]|uniref:polysaccharide pyruvyl transferase family protein n=1 Tax=Alteromonas gracilis TaxID=1479524 RepID=UPI002FE18A62
MAKLMGLGSGNNKLVYSYKTLYDAASSNTGNLLFNFALESLIELAGTDVRWSTPAEKINADGHDLLIPMANNIGKHMDLKKSGPKLDGIEVHKTVMGLGAQFPLDANFDDAFDAIPETSKAWLKQLCDSSEVANVSVRGTLTHKVFEKLGLGDKAVPLGCPSHFLSNNKTLGQVLKAQSNALNANTLQNGIAVTAGNPAIANLSKVEQFLIELINSHKGKYIVQHPKDLICLAEGWYSDISDEEVELVKTRFFPSYSTQEMKTWLRLNASTYVSIPQWFSDISKVDFVVGTRIHGCQLGIQAGVPAVVLHIDSRTKELCETMHIPTIEAREFQKDPSLDKLISLVQSWDWDRYDENRINLAKATYQFIENNNLVPTQHFKALLK